jgi:hyperosmotically inducible protein
MVTLLICVVTAAVRPAMAAGKSDPNDLVTQVRKDLMRLPYYGVFDFLAFSVDRGVVTLHGFAYHGSLKSDAARAVKRVSGVDEVANKITVLSASPNDDRIRWATFYSIYTDEFLSRYAPGGSMGARYDARQFSRFPGMQPSGTYPIHIIVNKGRTTLLGIVDNEADKTMAGFKAREVGGVFAVENELVVDKE